MRDVLMRSKCTRCRTNTSPTRAVIATQYNGDSGTCAGLPATAVPAGGGSVAVTLRSPADPYVRAGAITSCTLQFGPTPKSLAIAGGILVAIGSILTAGVCACLIVLKRSAFRNMKQSPVIPGYVAAPAPVSYQPAQTYNAPVSAYSAQQPAAYVQPQMQMPQPMAPGPVYGGGYAQPQAYQPQPYQPQAYQPQYYGRR